MNENIFINYLIIIYKKDYKIYLNFITNKFKIKFKKYIINIYK